jgi:hypothetical protein
MPEGPIISSRLESFTRVITTLLCCSWGYSFAYAFFRCVLDKSPLLVCLAAALPLLAVWASLERKRWGRLVVLGLSLLAQTMFLTILGLLMFSHEAPGISGDKSLFDCLRFGLYEFGESPDAALTVLLLSAASAIWFCTPWARAEYETRKQPYLSPGQRAIAFTVVSLWTITMINSPTVLERRAPNLPFRTPRRLTMRY